MLIVLNTNLKWLPQGHRQDPPVHVDDPGQVPERHHLAGRQQGLRQ